jgi:hypothetical protein
MRQRLNWGQHVKRLEWEGQFQRIYRMSVSSFNKVSTCLDVNLKQSCNASKGKQPIVTEVLFMTFVFVLGCQLHHFTE